MKSEIKRSFVDTLPVMAGYLVLCVGFGVLMKANGYGVMWSLGMSLFIYAGSMQYLAVSLLTAGTSLISAAVSYLGRMLPYAVMGMLVVYCLRNVSLLSAPFGLPELLACLCVVSLHWWRRNTMLSIIGGTAVYMLLIQFVF